MKKIMSLIKASMSEGMNLFRINTKKNNKFSKAGLPIFLTLFLMMVMFSYSEMLMEELTKVKMEFVLLTLFIILTSILTLIEGIYKTGNLLFNCKDDNLLLSLPIKRSTVLFIRVLKFYAFELLYNSVFLIPSLIIYAIYTHPGISYYIVSVIAILLFPIVPILLSCLIGTVITFLSSKFKGKNIVQTIITTIILLLVMYYSMNLQNIILNISKNASSINDLITKIYYPAGAYLELVTNYSLLKLFEFIFIHLGLFVITIILVGKIYFSVNSSIKFIKTNKKQKKYKVKTNSPIKSLIRKEFNRFINSPVFITNAGFGIVLFIVGCILIVLKFNSITVMFTQINSNVTLNQINSYMPVLLFAFICFTSFMTSITSSMISLEGKSFNILKSMPVKPKTIIKAKVLTAILIMFPCILIGDLIIFIKFKFKLLSIILLLISSILLPLVSETIGIMINLKYPKMDANNDTEVVKQSMSSSISVFAGLILIGITSFLLFKILGTGLSSNNVILIFNLIYMFIYMLLLFRLDKTVDNSFENIKI